MSEKRAAKAVPMNPVFVTIGENRWRIFSEDGKPLGTVADANSATEAIALWNGDDVRRLSTSLDACEGIPMEALEANIIPEMIDALRAVATEEAIDEFSPVYYLKRRAQHLLERLEPPPPS